MTGAGSGTVASSVSVAALAALTVGPMVLVVVRRTAQRAASIGRSDTAVLVALTGLTASVAAASDDVVLLLPVAALGVAAAAVDALEGRLPDVLTATLFGWCVIVESIHGRPGAAMLVGLGAGCAVGVLKVIVGDAIGWGDVKLAPTLAIVLVRQDAVAAGIAAMLLLVATTCLLIAVHDRRGRTPAGPDEPGTGLVPYGPALVVGVLGAVTLG